MRYLIKFNETEIVSVSEAPSEGATIAGSNYAIEEDLEAAKLGYDARGLDTSKIDEYLINN